MTALVAMPAAARAQAQPHDLAQATVEDLMNISITSAARHAQRADEVPAAVYVIDRDAIRRSGLTEVPELLRLAPGVQVARINASKWAVSIRGFNSLYSTKLLVMVDGRSIYNPALSTVLWDTEDVLVEDIDRIEVIRGPGGAMWGGNAVNGVINIITRPSEETRGLLARVTGAAPDTASAALRYGGLAGRWAYRARLTASAYGDTVASTGGGAHDHWHRLSTGARADWSSGSNSFVGEGEFTTGEQRPLWQPLGGGAARPVSSARVGAALGRWRRARPNGSTWQVQGFVDHTERHEHIGSYDRQTWDLDTQVNRVAGRHDLVAGWGYRYIREALEGGDAYAFNPGQARAHIVNAFGQDTIAIGRRVAVTAGLKFEYNSFVDAGAQPTLRVLWRASTRQRVWASWSSALRPPSIVDRGISIDPAPYTAEGGALVRYVTRGDPEASRERFTDVEAGYRTSFGRLSVDATAFAGRYDRVLTTAPDAPTMTPQRDGRLLVTQVFRFTNALDATTRGAEAAVRVGLPKGWTADGAVSVLQLTPTASILLAKDALSVNRSPAHQWRGHLATPDGAPLQADLAVYGVGRLDPLAVDGYTRVDARVEWRLGPHTSIVARGQNLLDGSHLEFDASDTNMQATRVPRSAALQVTWRY